MAGGAESEHRVIIPDFGIKPFGALYDHSVTEAINRDSNGMSKNESWELAESVTAKMLGLLGDYGRDVTVDFSADRNGESGYYIYPEIDPFIFETASGFRTIGLSASSGNVSSLNTPAGHIIVRSYPRNLGYDLSQFSPTASDGVKSYVNGQGINRNLSNAGMRSLKHILDLMKTKCEETRPRREKPFKGLMTKVVTIRDGVVLSPDEIRAAILSTERPIEASRFAHVVIGKDQDGNDISEPML